MVLTLAIGVGASSTLFSILNGVLLEPLPYPDSEKIVFFRTDFAGGRNLPSIAAPEFRDLRESSAAFQNFVGIWVQADNLTGTDQVEDKLTTAWVTRDFFSFFGSEMALGSEFQADSQGESGQEDAIILSHQFWTRRFGAAPDILGRTIEINRRKKVVTGVSAPDFSVLSPSAMRGYPRIDVYIPIPDDWWLTDYGLSREDHWLTTFARLGEGVTLDSAQAEIDGIAARWRTDYPDVYGDSGLTVRVSTMHRDLVSGIRKPIVLLFVAGIGVLFIAGCNAASLYLARGMARNQELALRSALGASGPRLFRQLVIECLLLVSVAGVAGMLPVLAVKAILNGVYPGAFPLRDRVEPDLTVLLFMVGVMLTATVFLAFVFFKSTRGRALYPALKHLAGGMDDAKSAGWRRVLVSTQVALAAALLTGSGLLLETSKRLDEVDLGFSPENVLTLWVGTELLPADRRWQHLSELTDRVESLPGVESVGLVSSPPFSGLRGGAYNRTHPFRTDQDPLDANRRAFVRIFGPGYFETLKARLVSGKWIGEREEALAAPEILVDEVLARLTWPDEDPVGKRLHFTIPFTTQIVTARVVGVVGHVQHEHLKAERRAQVYVPTWLMGNGQNMNLVVRAESAPLTLVKPIAAEILALGNEEPPARITTLEGAVDLAYADSNLILLVMTLFAASGLLLVTVGVYGIIVTDVELRRRETGIRMALGASTRQLLLTITGRSMSSLSTGLLAGVGLSFAGAHLLESQLYGVSTLEPVAFGSSMAIILVAALVASVVPARRAAKADPARILRSE